MVNKKLLDEKSECEWAQLQLQSILKSKILTKDLGRYTCIMHRALSFYIDHLEKEMDESRITNKT